MSNKLPKVFQNSSIKVGNTNKSSFYSFNNKEEKEVTKEINFNIKSILEDIESLFNLPVDIVTNNESYSTTIISKVKDHIMTSNSKIIYLKDIIDIKIKL